MSQRVFNADPNPYCRFLSLFVMSLLRMFLLHRLPMSKTASMSVSANLNYSFCLLDSLDSYLSNIGHVFPSSRGSRYRDGH